ncbi:MAG: NADH-quinone oxidoreductase subunit E, partial [Candidatus Kapaibacterium sp.]
MSERLKRVDVILGNYHPEKYKILTSVMDRSNAELIKDLIDSGLKGRGGAGFLTGLKWKFAAQTESDTKYVICNADEGEPGTFKDREILTKVPRKVLSGMGICAKVIGARKGYIYLRGEYKFLVPQLTNELAEFHEHCHKLGLDFTIEIFLGSGAYVCG